MNQPAPSATAKPALHIAKIESCESLSGLSTLEYHVGYVAGSKDRICFRIWTNSGSGKFNTDWVALSAIEKVLADVLPNGTFKAAAFNCLLPGKSVNTPAFIAAACLAEGLIRRSETVSRQYARNEATEWLAEVQALVEVGTNLSPEPMVHTAGDSAGKTAKAKARTPKRPKLVAAATA
jgi:hypothetical protein